MRALERNFPFEEIDPVAEKESYRKEVNRPIYHTHKWWAQRLGSVFRALTLGTVLDETADLWGEFYNKHDLQNAIILDPFMGSGTTVGEAIKLGCKAVGCDINPVSSFIVGQAFRHISTVKLLEAFNEIERKVKRKINFYYTKQHPRTGEQCQVLYYFWVKVVSLPNGTEIPLFSNYVFSKNAYPKKKPQAQIICPHCWEVIQNRYDLEHLSCLSCKNEFNPQHGPVKGQQVTDPATGKTHKIAELIKASGNPPIHKLYASMVLNSDGKKEYIRADEEDTRLYNEAHEELKNYNFPFPEGKISPGHNANQVLNYGYKYWSDFFNDRQLLCLGMLLDAILDIENEDIRDAFVCLFSGVLEFNNTFCSFKGEGTGAVRHLFFNHILKPERTPLENCVWGNEKSSGTFFSLFKSRLLKAQEYRDKPFEIRVEDSNEASEKVFCSNPIKANYVTNFEELLRTDKSCLVLNGDSAKLPIPDASIDAVVTDPPYFDFVHYSELSDFYFAWLKPALGGRFNYFNSENSRRVGEVQHKKSNDFSNALCNVFSECKRVLKDQGLLVFSFHHSRFEGWLSIYEAISNAGLHIQAVYPVKAEMSGGTPKTATKNPINLDAIFVCKKIESWESTPLSINAIVARATEELCDFETRFDAVGRDLSNGDRKVILSSLLLKYCSIAGHDPKTVSNEIDEKRLVELLTLESV